jgi:hypothetical protein
MERPYATQIRKSYCVSGAYPLSTVKTKYNRIGILLIQNFIVWYLRNMFAALVRRCPKTDVIRIEGLAA